MVIREKHGILLVFSHDLVTIFDPSCIKEVLFEEENLHSGTILNYLSLILVNDDRIFSLIPEFSNVGGVS